MVFLPPFEFLNGGGAIAELVIQTRVQELKMLGLDFPLMILICMGQALFSPFLFSGTTWPSIHRVPSLSAICPSPSFLLPIGA